MFTVRWVLLVVCCAILFSAVVDSISERISDATIQFSLDLLKTVLHDHPGSVILSPVSIYTLLAILQQGACSRSREELDNVLHATPDETKESYHNLTTKYQQSGYFTTLEFATRAFVRTGYNVEQEFKQSLVNDFLSDIESLNFSDTNAACQHINSWVAQNTHNRITQLVKPDAMPPEALLVLVNTIYFKSFWENFFHDTKNRTFSPRSGEEKQVPTMYQVEFYHAGVNSELGAKWVLVNFQVGSEYSVLLVLPTERHGLDNLVNRLTPENLIHFFFYPGYKRVTLTLPKFKLNTETKLVPVLKKLGLTSLFEDFADLSGISALRLKVTDVIQKAEVAIDETGVTASAATGSKGVFLSAHLVPNAEELEFKADQPFLFFIIDRENSVPLFSGRVSDPSTS